MFYIRIYEEHFKKLILVKMYSTKLYRYLVCYTLLSCLIKVVAIVAPVHVIDVAPGPIDIMILNVKIQVIQIKNIIDIRNKFYSLISGNLYFDKRIILLFKPMQLLNIAEKVSLVSKVFMNMLSLPSHPVLNIKETK